MSELEKRIADLENEKKMKLEKMRLANKKSREKLKQLAYGAKNADETRINEILNKIDTILEHLQTERKIPSTKKHSDESASEDGDSDSGESTSDVGSDSDSTSGEETTTQQTGLLSSSYPRPMQVQQTYHFV